MVFEIVGREAELASLNAFIGEMEGGPAALVLEGEAGVGKSTLWGAAVEHARVRGLTVLSSRPAEAERGLGNVGLGDLLEGVIDDVLAALLTPRRRALQVALLREEVSGEPVDRRTLAVAVHDALQLLSDCGPTLIAVDDVQWLDPSSSGALGFALRRLDGRPVLLLLTRRLAEGGHRSELERALPPDCVCRLIVGPLSVGALDAAVAARVVERESGMIRFTHPLLSSVLYDDLGEERRAVHARIAEVAEEPVLRARHLALSTDTPDADVACFLDDAATLASDRGAPADTAELAEHALRLTPGDQADERRRRALAAAYAHLAAGEWTRARSITTDLLARTRGPLRAEALLLLAEFQHDDLAVPLLEEAVREAASHPALQALIHIRLAAAERFRKGFAGALEGTRAALVLADRIGDDGLRFKALAQLSWLGGMVGDAEAPAYRARALDVATASGDARLLREANALLWRMLIDSSSIDAARMRLEQEHRKWQERDELFDAQVVWELSWLELWAGRWERAAAHAARARDIGLQYGVEKNQDYIPSAWVAVHRGQLELARQEAERGLKLCEEQVGFHPPLLQAVPGLVALWSGDAAAGADHLEQADRQAQVLGWGSPDARPWTADYAEALLELGRVDEAVRVVDRWEADASRLARDRVLAHVTRCRGLVAAARGAVDEAVALLEHAVERHDEAGDAFGRARALLALGVVRRRARQKRAARDAISAALAIFEQLGAATWIEKAGAELGRIGGRTRAKGLTAAERRVAALVAEGRTNREVAAALFLGERTVETHLSHVYAKLGVRSRAELARTFRADEQSSGALTISS